MNYWNKLFDKTILNIKYEDIVSNSENKIKELINFCGLDWEEQCLKYYDNSNPIKTLSANQANKPIYKTSINKFKDFENDLNILFSKLN